MKHTILAVLLSSIYIYCFASSGSTLTPHIPACPIAPGEELVLIGLGDSLTQGTMDATNNVTTTHNAYLQKVYESLAQVTNVRFTQPLLNEEGQRVSPFILPTNLGVDGTDLFSLEGLEYYKRYGIKKSFPRNCYLADSLLPCLQQDLYDKILYPINLLALRPLSQLDATIWLLNQVGRTAPHSRVVVIVWIGNNDSSSASLGMGTSHPTFIPLSLEHLWDNVEPVFVTFLHFMEQSGLISFEPYLSSSIERNLTQTEDFVNQYRHILSRIECEVSSTKNQIDIFICTLPYYNQVGYLLDSEDIEFYLKKINPDYTVPATFERVTSPGTSITDYSKGDRISLFTFLSMYVLLSQGNSPEYANQILEVNGVKRDGLVLSEDEQEYIISRIDSFNDAIKEITASGVSHLHLIDIGNYLNSILTGKTSLTLNGKNFNRKWGRGNSFTIDGVHPGYTAHTLIANYILEQLNGTLGFNAPLHQLLEVMDGDPYIDWDEDGWVSGPNYPVSGIAHLLSLFRDPDDHDPEKEPILPPDFWNDAILILLQELLL